MKPEIMAKLEQVCGFLRLGNSLKVAIHRSGISTEVFHGWMLENSKLGEAINFSLAEAQAKLEEVAYSTALESSSTKDALSILAVRDPENYNQQVQAKKLGLANDEVEAEKKIANDEALCKRLNAEAKERKAAKNVIDITPHKATQ